MSSPDQYFPSTSVNASPGFAAYAGQGQSDYESIIGGQWASTVGPFSAICYLIEMLPFMSGLSEMGSGSGFGAMGDLLFGLQTFIDLLCGFMSPMGGMGAAGDARMVSPAVNTTPQTVLSGAQAVSDAATGNPYYPTVMRGVSQSSGNAAIDAMTGSTAVADDAMNYAGNPDGLGSGTVSGQVPYSNVSGTLGGTNIGESSQMMVDSMVQPLFSVWGTGYGLADVSNGINGVQVGIAATTDVAEGTSAIQMGRAVTKPTYNATDPTADAVFQITSINGSTPTFVDVTANTSAMGFITTPDAGVKKTVIWHGQNTAGITSLKVVVYKMNTTTGVLTRLSTSGNLIGDLTSDLSWEYYNLPQSDWITTVHGDVYAIEIAVSGSGTYQVVGMPNHWLSANQNVYPKQLGATRDPIDMPTFGSVGQGYSTAGTNMVTNFSFGHTMAADDTALVLCIGTADLTNATATASVGGRAMTQLDAFEYFGYLGTREDIIMLVLLNPPTGPQTVSVTLSGSAHVTANTISFKKVSGFGSAQRASGQDNPMTQTVSAAADDRIVQFFVHLPDGSSITGYDKTQRWALASVSNGRPAVLIGEAAGAASVDFNASATNSQVWGGLAVPLLGTTSTPDTIASPTYSSHVPWFAIGGTASATKHAPQITQYSTPGNYTYTVPGWANYVDVIAVGGGGGSGGVYADGGDGGFSRAVAGATTVTGAGGAGGEASGGDQTGHGPGNQVFSNVAYYGGPDATSLRAPGNAPGGGGAGYIATFGYHGGGGYGGGWATSKLSKSFTTIAVTVGAGGAATSAGGPGAAGAVWIRAYQ